MTKQYMILEVTEGCDRELPCVFCNLLKCDHEATTLGPGRRTWSGLHQKCLNEHHARLREHLQSQPRPLHDRILSMVFAFDKDDSRRDEVRALASEVQAIETLLAEITIEVLHAQAQGRT